MIGNIFDIQRFSVHDGPGIRTIVFFKGCPLRCIWCHNPESQKVKPNVALYSDKCRSCGECLGKCEHSAHLISGEGIHTVDRSKCIECGECISSCPFGALEIFGREADSAEIMEEVMKDLTFYKNSHGGVTFSGGEPLMQGEFLTELLTLSKERGLHTAIETSGYAAPEAFTRLITAVDYVMMDLKLADDGAHRRYTGVSNKPILENLAILRKSGKPFLLRTPLIPGITDTEENLTALAAIVGSDPWEKLPYHSAARDKHERLGLPYFLP